MKEFAPRGANSFFKELTPTEKGDKIVELLSLKVYPFTLILLTKDVLAAADLLHLML